MKTLVPSLLLILALSAHAAQPGGAEKAVTPVPVGKDMLDGTRLVLKTAGCSIDIPGPGWSWMTYDNAGRNYLCMNARTFELYMVSLGELKGDMVAHQPESLIASAKKTMEAHGGKLEGDKYEFFDTPGTKKSAHVSFAEIDKTKKSYVSIYLINTIEHALLKIHCSGTNPAEPDAFKAMLKSLKMTK